MLQNRTNVTLQLKQYRGKMVKLPYLLSVQGREENQAPRRAAAATGSKLLLLSVYTMDKVHRDG